MRTIAYIQKRASDLSGIEAPDEEFVVVTVRESPWTTSPVKLDVLPDEIKGLRSAGQLVVLEINAPGQEPRRLIVTATEFRKLHENVEGIVKAARGNRGRPPGFKPGQPKS